MEQIGVMIMWGIKVTEVFLGASWSKLELKAFKGWEFKVIEVYTLAT